MYSGGLGSLADASELPKYEERFTRTRDPFFSLTAGLAAGVVAAEDSAMKRRSIETRLKLLYQQG